jgi:hypothetical protein
MNRNKTIGEMQDDLSQMQIEINELVREFQREYRTQVVVDVSSNPVSTIGEPDIVQINLGVLIQ